MAKESKELNLISESTNDTSGGNYIPETKWVNVFVNGDEYSPGLKCVVNNKHHRNLEAFLNYITQRLQPSFGAVRNIYSCINGYKITSLDELLPNQDYVVAGNEKFKKVEYGYTQIKHKLKKNTSKPIPKVKYNNRSNVKRPSNNRKSAEVTIIYVHKNGDYLTPPEKFVLRKWDLFNWDKTLEMIGSKVRVSTGYVKKLCTMKGQDIKKPEELANRQSYVAIGANEKFKNAKYNTVNFSITTTQMTLKPKKMEYPKETKNQNTNKMVSVKEGVSVQKSDISIQVDVPLQENNTISETVVPLQNSDIHVYKQKTDTFSEKLERLNYIESYAYGPGDGVFKAQQQKILDTNIIEINLDKDHGGLFRASEQLEIVNGAKEIQESADTIIEFPVDEMEAEEIEDEITPEMERAIQDLDLNSSQQFVAFCSNIPTKNSVTSGKQITMANNNLGSQLPQNMFV